ncbi:Polyketide cyclase / dehydrase and lipid transport [Klenkia soli]|uniref:Polyketide cyclase / dehydrase and lipid transport n=1 Tax=Klenkia soli TaxID=1052260 RepID=A0A1H0QA62_9ACTN|nr:SRPBCC family protein [Klenkia soli]SDP14070.1 Polyketide cyclase / dehydrase and lipid transport [Klenkia soli]
MASRTASGSTVVDASPAEVFALLADPRRHAEIDGSGTVQRVVSAPERLELGSEFSMAMRMGARYRVTNRVVEFEADRLIAWRHVGLHRWRYELEPATGGTRVTETWDATRYPRPAFWVLRAMGFPATAQRCIDGTLRQLEERFGTDG